MLLNVYFFFFIFLNFAIDYMLLQSPETQVYNYY